MNDEAGDADEEGQRYRAPALDKGLDVIELLARSDQPLTLSQISAALGRSISELHRMIRVLERRGYIVEPAGSTGFVLARKLFALASAQTPTQTLLEAALPRMRELTWRTGQSCHLSVRAEDEMTVVARIAAPGMVSFAVRVGRHRKLIGSNSGTVLFAHADPAAREALRRRMAGYADAAAIERFMRATDAARAAGHHRGPSDFVVNVTDICAPVFGGDEVAALTIPFITLVDPPVSLDDAQAALLDTTREISAAVEGQPHD